MEGAGALLVQVIAPKEAVGADPAARFALLLTLSAEPQI